MERLDVYLVNNGMASTRSKAQQLIKSGYVLCNGVAINKNSYQVEDSDEITVSSYQILKYVSRGGLKLEKAIHTFGIDFTDKTVLDIGSSTGGFTDCAIQHGAKKVYSIDVGQDIMDKSLSSNPKVVLYENTDIRSVSSELLRQIDLIVCDVSFISLKAIIPHISKKGKKKQCVFLIKPQFECGKEQARRHKGIVNNPSIHLLVLNDILSYFQEYGYKLNGITFSPIQGGDGNIEYITWFSDNEPLKYDIKEIINEAFSNFNR